MKQKRTTVAKLELIEVLEKSAQAMSHGELFDQLQQICDRVTVYRILERLTQEGMVHRIALPDGTVKFALCETCEEGHHHHAHVHFNCKECGIVSCLDAEVPKVKLPGKYIAEDVNLVVTGICAECR